jgi:hypothetical protein
VNVPSLKPFGTTYIVYGSLGTTKITRMTTASLHNTKNKHSTSISLNNMIPSTRVTFLSIHFNIPQYQLLLLSYIIRHDWLRSADLDISAVTARNDLARAHTHNTSFITLQDALLTLSPGNNPCPNNVTIPIHNTTQ